MAKDKTFKTHVDLPKDVRDKMVDLCNAQLADTSDLYSQIKQAHWNLKGPEFIALHLLFDTTAEHVLDHVDTIAERASQLGGKAMGTARMAAANSRLPELPNDIDEGLAYVSALVERMGLLANSTRAAIDEAAEAGDQTTADVFTQVSRSLDKDLWFLEAHIQE